MRKGGRAEGGDERERDRREGEGREGTGGRGRGGGETTLEDIIFDEKYRTNTSRMH